MSDPQIVDAGVQPGDVLAEKYRVEAVLGAGGMGVVVSAHHLHLDEKVAIKFLKPEALERKELLARFEREARAAVKIKSEHVARVLDVGRLASGAPYMVMEHLEGGDLRAWLHERKSMPAWQAAEFVLQACEAIAEAHALGIVHRDLKPANLFCIERADGLLSIKVLDFGISKVSASARGSLPELDMTSTGAVVGSPVYMSPEQLKASKEVDTRTDLWSLGVILYELVSGRAPFQAAALTELAIDIATATPPPLRELVEDLPAGFEDVVMRSLVKDREKRMQSVGELAIALKEYAPKRAWGSVERVLRTMRASGSSTPQLPPSGSPRAAYADTVSADDVHVGTASSWGQTGATWRKQRDRKALVSVAVAVGLVVVLGGGAAVLRSRMRSDPQPAPSGSSTPAASIAITPPTASGTIAAAPTSTGSTADLAPAPSMSSQPAPSKPPSGPRPANAGPATKPPPSSPPAPSAAPTCRIVTEYDAEGQPHFKKVCN